MGKRGGGGSAVARKKHKGGERPARKPVKKDGKKTSPGTNLEGVDQIHPKCKGLAGVPTNAQGKKGGFGVGCGEVGGQKTSPWGAPGEKKARGRQFTTRGQAL